MKKLFRILAFCLVLCLAAGLFAGCGKGGSSQRMQAELHIYDTTEVDTGLDDLAEYFNTVAIGPERVWATSYEYTDEGGFVSLLTAKLDGTDARKVDLPLQEIDMTNGGQDLAGIAVAADGTVCVMEQNYFYGTEENDYTDSGASYYLHRLAADGTHQSVTQLDIPQDSWPSFYNMVCGPDGTCYATENSNLLVISPDGQLRSLPIVEGEGYVERIAPLADGNVIVTWSGSSGGDWGSHTCRLDTATGKLGEDIPISENMRYDPVLCDANGKLYIYDSWGIYTLDEATGATELICSWLDSDIDFGSTVQSIVARTDGTFVSVGYGENWDKLIVTTLSYVDPATLPEKTVLTVACNYGYDMQRAALKFNKKSDTVRITVKQYSDYNTEENEWTGAITQMNTDIVTGNTPDILLIDEQLPFHNYVSKGLFTDLYALLDSEGSPVKRSDILPNILTAHETDGKLTSIPDSFGLITFAGNADLVGSEPGWTWDEFFALLDANPQITNALSGDQMLRDWLLQTVLVMSGDQFVDYDAGTCNFDNPTFQKILEYAKTYPAEYDSNYEYVNPKDLYASGKGLLYQANLYDFDYALREISYYFDGNPSYIGMPTLDGSVGSAIVANNRLAISEACPDKAAAWEFVSSFLTEEYQTENIYSIPVRLDAIEEKIAQAMDPETHGDYGIAYGSMVKEIASSSVATVEVTEEAVEEEAVADDAGDEAADGFMEPVEDGPAILLPEDSVTEEDYFGRPTSQAEIDLAMAAITGTNAIYRLDTALMSIIMEEANAFFAGSKSVADTVAIIQNRAQTYLAESR